jgi:hypothetical protein
MPKYGDIREDGYRYVGIRPAIPAKELWLSPEAWEKKLKANAENIRKSRERKRLADK